MKLLQKLLNWLWLDGWHTVDVLPEGFDREENGMMKQYYVVDVTKRVFVCYFNGSEFFEFVSGVAVKRKNIYLWKEVGELPTPKPHTKVLTGKGNK